MPSRRPRTSLALVGMGIILLAAVFVGQQIGEHTIFGATQRRVQLPEQPVTPVPEDTGGPAETISKNWKRLQVVSVATDPAFPDPRVTPPPTPSPRPSPTQKPTPAPAPYGLVTAPPLPLPLGSQLPEASATP